ncbi:putative MFS-type transporter [Ceratocystis platani]|uniref:Putative MFS-type transporter n=1 Tax=Ceratocystis fimbriata f. sp. platani TaxID=88771 RepID=A0A0F8B0X3_CERFI|nr:putative MFS-type transporter [Ceratocystis platani]
MTASEIVGATNQDSVVVLPEIETEPKGDPSLIIVAWDGPNDPQDPFNWSLRKKWLATGLGLFATFISLVNGSIITVAHEAINDEFGVSDAKFPHSYWPVTSWGVGGALFSLVILPVMEDFGIRTVFLITYFLFICFLAPIGPANSFATLVIVRFFSGGCVAILANTVVGILTNVFNGDRARSPAMSLYILIYLAASSSGPVIGAVIFDYLGWRWLGYAELIWTAVFMPLFVFGMPESRSSVLLRQKSKRMRAEGLNAYTIEELDTTPLVQIVAKSVQRPLYMLLTESVVFVSTMWSAFSLGTIYLFTQSVEQVYNELYGWDAVRSGYIQAAIVIGEILGWAFCLMTNHWYYNSAARNREAPGKPIPEARLYQAVIGGFFGVTGGMFVYAWTAYPDTRWEAPTVGLVVIGFGSTAVVQSISNYLIDAYSKYAGSAIAAVCLGENMFIALLPLAATSMYTTLGLHWASSLLGFISLAMVAAPLAVLKWGRKIRDRSPFMKEATIEDRKIEEPVSENV